MLTRGVWTCPRWDGWFEPHKSELPEKVRDAGTGNRDAKSNLAAVPCGGNRELSHGGAGARSDALSLKVFLGSLAFLRSLTQLHCSFVHMKRAKQGLRVRLWCFGVAA